MTTNRPGPPVFEVVGDEQVHTWAMFKLLRRVLRDPRGSTFERSFVATPGAVAVVALTTDGRVVLVSQYRPSVDAFVLEIPAGMRDVDGEEPVDTARRELEEETGWRAGRLQFLGRCLSSPAITDSTVLVYLGTDIVPGEPTPHGPEEESMSVLTPTLAEAVEMVVDGRITDAKTAYGILLASSLGQSAQSAEP